MDMAEQKIKTYYKPVSDEYVRKPDQILEEQQKRVELNRKLREEQSSLTGKAKRAITGAAGSGVEWMKRRGQEIQREGTGIPAPRRTPMAGMPRDPFGMGSGGNPFHMGPMTGPFMDRAGPIQPPRRKGKRRRRRDDDDDSGMVFSDPFHIPKSMRHMF
jgi:hypothetical protein